MRASSKGAALARALVAPAIAAALLASPGVASAFCRTSSCPGVGTSKVCSPPEADDCGIAIFWPTECVGYSLQKDASSQISLELAEEIFAQAFDTWTSATCPEGGKPHIRVEYLGPIECSVHEYNQADDLGNANVIIFRDAEWPHEGAGSTLALTTVTYNTKNGEIYDADMEINSAQTKLTTGDTGVLFDLGSIAAHEAGHFLGLSHSPVTNATMMAEYKPGTTSLQDLSDDDALAICDVYPEGAPIPDTCDATPRHGFSAKCSADVIAERSEGCCVIAAGFQPGGGGDGEDGENGGNGAVQRTPIGRGGRAAGILALAALALAARRSRRAVERA